MNYSETDIKRMKYYYKEMAEKLKKYPNSLPLINGMAHIEKVCGLPLVTTPRDPTKVIDEEMEQFKKNMLR